MSCRQDFYLWLVDYYLLRWCSHQEFSRGALIIRWYIAQPLLPVRILAMKCYLNRNGKDFVSKSYESQDFSSLLKWYPESTSSPLIKSLQPTLKALLLDRKIEKATSTKIVERLLILDCFSCCIIHCWFTTTLFTSAGYFVSKLKSEFSTAKARATQHSLYL